MNVHLTDEQKEFVKQRLASGGYASASEVIRAGLRALEEDDHWRGDIRTKFSNDVAQARLGQLLDGDGVFKELVDRIDGPRKIAP